jgi:hypothetical protein
LVPHSVGGNKRAPLFYCGFGACLAAFPSHRREAFPFADELFNLAQAIAEHAIAHANDR